MTPSTSSRQAPSKDRVKSHEDKITKSRLLTENPRTKAGAEETRIPQDQRQSFQVSAFDYKPTYENPETVKKKDKSDDIDCT
ncbi:hypothetical protein L218DRAFT_959905 [Marasmius fiardii PR-910]|nr:hypothetical protein L218DRAFT_959905 [Marasmius fiardii PR-910]